MFLEILSNKGGDKECIKKALAMRMNNVLGEIIERTQTAYVRVRSVTDNLSSMMFLKNYCKEEKVEAVLISLDAKKAFDSVDHNFIETTLIKYGFCPKLINHFELLYKSISSKIMINGHQSETVQINRGLANFY